MTINSNVKNNNNEEELNATWSDFSEELKSTKQIVKYFTRPNNFIPFEIHWKDIDNFDFVKNAFNEILLSPQYVHLYFDFEKITTNKTQYPGESPENRENHGCLVTGTSS